MTTIRRQLKNVVKNYSEAEVKVREATSNDPWGPSSTLMSEISDLTYNIVALGDIMRMIWKRLNDHGKNWRHVYKSLVLLDYLIKNGNEKVAQQCKEHIVAIQTLKDFQYLEENKDQGSNVRDKAKNLVSLLRDDERLKQERQKALKARERFAQNAMGISSDNKITYAVSGQSRYAGSSTKTGGNYSDPYGGSSTGVGDSSLAPDLEAVRPSDPNEEELQVSLALMLSQQEHEEEVKRKRADEAKLQLALEQSKFDNASGGVGGASANTEPYSKTLLDLASGFNGAGAASASSHDPWNDGNNLQQLNDPWSSNNDDMWMDDKNNRNQNNNKNPWSLSSSQQQQQQQLNDPWSVSSSSSTPITELNTNKNNHSNLLDDFDVFTSNRVVSPPSAATVMPTPKNDPFDDFFGNSNNMNTNSLMNTNKTTNPWSNVTVPSAPQLQQQQQQKTPTITNSAIRKTPESFLGENSSLVNLDNLIPTTTSTNTSNTNNQRPKSTNPFGNNTQSSGLATSLSSSSIQPRPPSVNPFQAQVQKGPTINQLTYQQQQQNSQFGGFNGSGNSMGFLQQTPQQPQLSQPLIPPANTNNFQTNHQSTNPFLMM